MVIVKASKDSEAGKMPSQELLTEMGNYNEELVKAGIMLAGEGLHPSSRGARVHFKGKDRTVIDGPFAETKELIAGFWIWKVNSMQEAIDWLKRCPNPHEEEGDVEIRQIFEADDFGEAFTPELREQEASIRAQALKLGAPRFEEGRELLVAGLNETYTFESRFGIPAQWERFAPQIGKVPGQVGKSSYGVVWNYKLNSRFDYLSGVEVKDTTKLPKEFAHVRIPAQRYAVFTHEDHISSISKTIDKIWKEWVPDCGLKIAESPCFERYTEEFNPQTGMGGTEIWVPISR
jgi:predicted transcriptional regulator YdeE